MAAVRQHGRVSLHSKDSQKRSCACQSGLSMLLRIFPRLRGGVRIARRVAEVARIEQSEIRDRAVRPAPDFLSLNPGYACYSWGLGSPSLLFLVAVLQTSGLQSDGLPAGKIGESDIHMTKLRVFVGSPGDVPQEREIVSVVVSELSRTVAPIIPIELEAIMWETHTWPDVGADAQDVVNRQIGNYDVFVGIMWRRLGTPTKRAKSGTSEEFELAYKYFKRYQRPKIMFYFRRTPFFSTDDKELQQFSKVIKFRKQLQKYGVLFWEYDDTLDFERRFREHLINQILQLQKRNATTPALGTPKIFLSYKRQDRSRVEPVYEAFRAAGFSPWMDVRDILPGGQWVK